MAVALHSLFLFLPRGTIFLYRDASYKSFGFPNLLISVEVTFFSFQ